MVQTGVQSYLNGYWSGDQIVLLRRDEQGRLVERRERAEYSFFLRVDDWPRVERDIRSNRRIAGHRLEGEYVRVVCRDAAFRYQLCRGIDERGGYFQQRGIEVLEADLHPVRRFLIDSGCDIQRPRAAYLDLETDSRVPFSRKEEMRILCWSLTLEDGERVGGVLEEDSDACERELLEDLWYELGSVDQVRTWNGAKFDEPVLWARTKRAGVRVEPRRWCWLDHMECFRKYNAHSTESGEEKESVALTRVAESLGIDTTEKESVDAAMSYDLWAAGGDSRQALFRRNVFDSWSMQQIESKTGYCDLHYAVCKTSGCFPDSRGLRALVHVESMVMRLGAERGVRFPTKWGQENQQHEKFRGALVLDTVPGLHRNVHVCDFSGMYPGIIQSWNMSSETHRPLLSGRPGETLDDVLRRVPPGHSVAPETLQVFDTSREGILAIMVGTSKKLRKKYNEIKKHSVPNSPEWKEADRISQGYKIAVNSGFGVASSPFSRLFKREVGESITTTGAWLIRQTLNAGADRWQLRAVAGDTDSLMVVGVSEETFRRFKDECNRDLYPGIIKRLGCSTNELDLEYEKEFAIAVFSGKKRYAGRYLHYKGSPANLDSKPEVKGYEYKRGDASRLARAMQKELLWKMLLVGDELPDEYALRPEDFHEMILRWKARVLEQPLTRREVTISKSLKGEPDTYAREPKNDGSPAAEPIHVAVARVLEARGEDMSEGSRVEYVVVDGDATPQRAIPASDWTPGLEDRAHIWEKMVFPPSRRVLEAVWPEHPWGRFAEGKDRGGGKGRSAYLPGQHHMPWF